MQMTSGRAVLREQHIDRRAFLVAAAQTASALSAAAALQSSLASAAPAAKPLVVDTHMHVWPNDSRRYPCAHPYQPDFKEPPHKGTLEMLIDDMDQHGCTHAVLVQVIYHGWDNSYVADCVKRYPERLKAHGLINPADPKVADKLAYWMKERGLHGMRFSPIYYQNGNHGGDGWLDAPETHQLWKKAAELGAVFNFFIAPPQLPKLAKMAAAHPDVRVIVDHLGRVDLKSADSDADLRLLLDMARHRNVWVKVSELNAVSKSGKYPYADAFPYVKRVYEVFGPDRLLFGTGFPGDSRAAYQRPTLPQEIDIIRKEIPFFTAEDREKILGRNAAKLWGW